jgi:hypothetical protein
MKKLSLLSLLIAFLLFACGNAKKEKTETTQDSIPKDSVEKEIVLNPFFNDISAYLAGKVLADNSHLAEYTQNSEWENYAKEIDQSWENFETEKLSLIKPWIDTEVADIQKETRHAFYPFSGPDFVYLYAFLDKSDYYYLFGLEPAGVVPDISKIGTQRNSFFAALNNAIKDNLNLSFFITKSMKEQMNNEQIKGTIPVLLFFMARFDLHVQDIKAAEINENGELVVKKTESLEELNQTLENIVEISFVKKGENTLKKLYYFSMNIRNDGFEKNPENEKYLRSLPKDMTSFVKSSSYCMHEEKYSRIRDIVLSHTKYLIQDDSGVPFRFFENSNWDFSFYGEYSSPIPVFRHFTQEDYKKEFNSKKKALAFRFGYSDPSNIFVAKRK